MFVICDDLNDVVEGMGGSVQAHTPNMSKLAEEGVLFMNAHSNFPICAPSRASLFSGIYPNKSGVMDFIHWKESPVLKDAVSIFDHFKNNGYQVYGTGKLHHFEGDFKNTWIDENGQSTYGEPTSYGPFVYNGETIKTLHPSMAYLANFITDEHAKIASSMETSFGPLSDVPHFDPDIERNIPGFDGWYNGTSKFEYIDERHRDSMPDELSAQWAIKKLQEKHDAPFFLGVGFVRPHTPLFVPKKYFDMFPLENIQLPPYKENDLDDCQDFVNYVRKYGFDRFDLYKRAGGELLWKKFMQAYLASVAFADDQLGKVLDALENSDYADNTIVVFTSDHGFHLGEKDYNFKDTNWEESSRIPLIIAMPNAKQKGKTVNHAVSLIDIYPTLNDLCGISNVPNRHTNQASLDGFSLRPFLENPETDTWSGPDAALIATYGEWVENGKQIVQGEKKAHNFSLRNNRYRYTRYENGAEELYDHDVDPNEWTNIAKDKSQKERIEAFRTQLDGRLKESITIK
ncbi:sulfatase [Jejuia pallidilutea]|uniref:sulfatase n=1 Tax=Jejuia pallidilutea TaxID=504487 RepID=UPI001475FFBA|nr:sulfatase [Jejuia pallidilutea]